MQIKEDQIERWANYVRNNPDWKSIHTKFINAQFIKHKAFIERLLKQPDGKKKLELLRELRRVNQRE